MQLVNSQGAALELKPWKRPSRTVRTFNVYVKGKKVECVTTKGERYTYLCVDGTDFYVDALLTENEKYKTQESPAKAPKAAVAA